MKRRVLIAEDELLARELLVRGLSRAGYDVLGVADGVEALARLEPDHDFVITDLVMPRADGMELLEGLNRRAHPAARIVVTSFADKERVLAALNLGADYLLEKPFGIERLCGVLERIERERGTDTRQLAHLFRRRLDSLPLTPREHELVELVLRGDSNKQIAFKLGITEQSVKNMLSHAYASLGVQSRGELFHRVFPV